MRRLLVCAAAALVAGTFTPNVLASGRKPGSVLIYPVHRSGPGWFTIISVTNTNVTPKAGTNVHFEYRNAVANPANPFVPLDCVVFDRVENLTHADTLSVLTTCHNAFGPGGSEGYLVVSAEDPTKFATAWSWNYLIGSALVVNATGIVYAVNAIPFESPVAEGQPTDLNSNRQLDFDDKEYEGVPDVLMIDSFVALANSSLALLNLTGGKHDTNFLMFYVWNDNEFPLSTTLQFVCWFDQPLSVISQLFSAAFLARLKNDPAELDLNCDGKGDLETGWAMIDSLSVRQPGGNLVANDGAFLGSITAGQTAVIDGGRLLWESKATQDNGTFFAK